MIIKIMYEENSVSKFRNTSYFLSTLENALLRAVSKDAIGFKQFRIFHDFKAKGMLLN